MDQSIRNYLGISLIILSVVGAFGVVYYTATYARSQVYTSPAFSVSGEGKVTAIPDVAQFTFSVVTEGGIGIEAVQTKNTETTNKVIEFVKSSGVDAKDIKTVSYNVSPRYSSSYCGPISLYYSEDGSSGSVGVTRPEFCPPAEIVGYTVEQTIQVKVRNLEDVGNLLEGVVENGANLTSQLTFIVDNRTQYENEARALAITEAKEKAETIAEAGGFKIGELLSVDEYFYGPYYADGFGGGGYETADVKVSPSIEPGSQEITVSVTLRYEIK